jgi:hypothetical protein
VYKDELARIESEIHSILREISDEDFTGDESRMICLHKNLAMERYIIVFSSFTLLKNLVEISKTSEPFVHLDTTYNLMQNGLLLMIMSTETLNHELRLISLAITLSESSSAYETLISKTIEAAKK